MGVSSVALRAAGRIFLAQAKLMACNAKADICQEPKADTFQFSIAFASEVRPSPFFGAASACQPL